MIPLGYMLKKVVAPPAFVSSPDVELVYSVSACVSENFADYIPQCKHNGWWFFDEPEPLCELAAPQGASETFTLFYYECHDEQYDQSMHAWTAMARATARVTVTDAKVLRGYDVVTFFQQTLPECSPLSCNGLAGTLPVNRFCLLDSFEQAVALIESAAFDNFEPGPLRIIAVYTVGPAD